MGEVYRARDRKLDRDVAIKVLPERVATDPEALARFEREAKSVAALSHHNILSIFDFGTQDGTSYAVTELLEGETLRDKLSTGPVSKTQAVDWALQIATGLSAAHERGVVHRDLKPENLFISTDGHLKILDFGLAKRFDTAPPEEKTSAPTGHSLTEPGTVFGTAAYMSPEQIKGFVVDHRSDIFSFGTVLYELLSGREAFKRSTDAETLAAILLEAPPQLSESGRNVSPALEHVVAHCLEKDRVHRFQTAKDVAFALSEASHESAIAIVTPAQPDAPTARKSRVLVAAVAVALVAAAAALLLRRPNSSATPAAGVKRVAVLPFENLGAPEDDYFADGIADEVRGKLTAIPDLQVIARGSSTPYKKTTKTPSQIAQELDANYLLTATVRWEKRAGTGRVHVIPELVDVTRRNAPTSKWQQTFDAALTDVFQVQSDIASRVARALGAALGATEEKRLSETPTKNPAAYDAFLKGEELRHAGSGDPAILRKQADFYEQSVALDPGFALAWAKLANAAALLYFQGTPTPALAERSREAAERALALAPNRPEGYQALADYERLVTLDNARALEKLERALRLAPGDTDVLKGMALAEEGLGRWDAAVEHFRQAARFDPRSANNDRLLGDALLRLRRYPEAREAVNRGLLLDPPNLTLIHWKAMSYLGEGNLAAARAVLDAAPKEVEPTALVAFMANYEDLVWLLNEEETQILMRLTPSAFYDDRGTWAYCLTQACWLKHDAGNTRRYAEEARKAFEDELRATPDDAQRIVIRALSLAYLGRKEEAIREGERAAALSPVSKDTLVGCYVQHQLVRVYILGGEPEKALERLEPLLRIPYYLSPGWLKVDPNFDPLRGDARFQRLVAGK